MLAHYLFNLHELLLVAFKRLEIWPAEVVLVLITLEDNVWVSWNIDNNVLF